MADNIGNEGATEETSKTNTQEEVKNYTQEEVDAMMAKTRNATEHKVAKKFSAYETVDLEEYKTLKQQAEEARTKKQIEKGEFEKTLQELASKKDAEIAKYKAEVSDYKVNTPIVNAAAKNKAVNPEQVLALLKGQVRLNEMGEAEVVDANGNVRYNDDGKQFEVGELVREFLDSNPHHLSPTPSTTNTQSSHGVKAPGDLDITKLDMKNPEHRAVYAEYRKKHGIA